MKAARLFRRHLGPSCARSHQGLSASLRDSRCRGVVYDINRKRLAASRENSAFQPLAASCGTTSTTIARQPEPDMFVAEISHSMKERRFQWLQNHQNLVS